MIGYGQDDNGKWVVDFRWQGRRIRRWYDEQGNPLQTKEDAGRLYRTLLYKLEHNEPITKNRRGPRPADAIPTTTTPALQEFTVGDAILAYLELSTRKPSYKDIDRSCRMWLSEFGSLPVHTLSSLDIERVLERRAVATSNGTANRDLNYLRAAMRKAWQGKKVSHDPTAGVKKLKEPKKRKRWLKDDEGKKLWDALKTPQDRRLMLFIVNTALRRGNACAIEWAWVDWETSTLQLPKKKGGDAHTIPLNSVALGVLREQHEQSGDGKYVWLGARGAAINARWWWKKRLRPALVAAGLIGEDEVDSGSMPSFRTHDLRHTFATRATRSGVHMQETQEILGHANITTTADYYSHADDDQLRKAVELAAWSPQTSTTALASYLRTGSKWDADLWNSRPERSVLTAIVRH